MEKHPIDYLILVNPFHKIPEDFVDNLELVEMKGYDDEVFRVEKEAARQFCELQKATAAAGIEILLSSAYRSVEKQLAIKEEFTEEYGADYAKRYLDTLRARFAVLSEFGLKATFDGMEPAYLPEAAYCDHPNWRGPACQHSRRSRHEYFAPCLDDAEFRAIYVRAIADLCRAVPFESFNLLVNDSGSGLCWCPHS